MLPSGTFLAQIEQDWPEAFCDIMLTSVSWFTILIVLSMCREEWLVFTLHYSLSNFPLKKVCLLHSAVAAFIYYMLFEAQNIALF